jgi:hypothetical protein
MHWIFVAYVVVAAACLLAAVAIEKWDEGAYQ